MNGHLVYCVKLHLEIKQLKSRLEAADGRRLTLEARLATMPVSLDAGAELESLPANVHCVQTLQSLSKALVDLEGA